MPWVIRQSALPMCRPAGYGLLPCAGAAIPTARRIPVLSAGASTGYSCNPNWGIAQVGGRVAWTPVKGLTFSGEVMWTNLDAQKMAGTTGLVQAGLAAGTKPPAVAYEFGRSEHGCVRLPRSPQLLIGFVLGRQQFEINPGGQPPGLFFCQGPVSKAGINLSGQVGPAPRGMRLRDAFVLVLSDFTS